MRPWLRSSAGGGGGWEWGDGGVVGGAGGDVVVGIVNVHVFKKLPKPQDPSQSYWDICRLVILHRGLQ